MPLLQASVLLGRGGYWDGICVRRLSSLRFGSDTDNNRNEINSFISKFDIIFYDNFNKE